MMKPKVHNQGKVIAENQGTDEWLVMFPNGDVESFGRKSDVEAAARRYFKKRVRKGTIGVGRIEWRT
jgi:hypothetical protein